MAPSVEERIELARSGVEMYEAGDIEGAVARMHPEIECYSEGLDTTHFRGVDGFLSWAAQWNEAWESFHQEVERIEPIGERHVVAVVDQVGRGRDSGIEVTQRAALIFEVDDDGRSVYFALYLDPDRALAAARAREGIERPN